VVASSQIVNDFLMLIPIKLSEKKINNKQGVAFPRFEIWYESNRMVWLCI